MKIMTKRLLLRPFLEKDSKDWYYMTQDKAAYRYLPYICPVTIYQSIGRIRNCYSKCDFENKYYFIIDERSIKKPIGAIFIIKDNNSNAFEVFFLISKDFRRHGYMEEALNGLLKQWPNGKPLFFDIDSDNYAAQKLMDKITSARMVLSNLDRVVYSITK